MAFFSEVHDGTVSTTTRDGRVASYKISEHKVGSVFDGEGKPIDDPLLDGVTTEALKCTCPEYAKPKPTYKPAADAVKEED